MGAGGTSLDVRLRPATPADYEFALDLFERTMRPYAEQTWGVWLKEKAQDEIRRDCADGRAKIIEVNSAPVGMLRVDQEPPTHLQLEKLNVLPDHQRKGIGSLVLNHVISEAKQLGLPVRLRVLRVNPAKGLYERHGFTVTREEDVRFHMECAF